MVIDRIGLFSTMKFRAFFRDLSKEDAVAPLPGHGPMVGVDVHQGLPKRYSEVPPVGCRDSSSASKKRVMKPPPHWEGSTLLRAHPISSGSRVLAEPVKSTLTRWIKTVDQDTLEALKTLTAGGSRDLLVLLTPTDEQYAFLARHITIPILVVADSLERVRKTNGIVRFREKDSEITLPCRPGGLTDLINLSVALALLEGVMAIGCRAVFVSITPNSDDCVIVAREISESSFDEWHQLIVGPLLSVRRAVRDVLAVALELGRMRKRPTGAMYIIGDTENVLARSTQLIMNPFGGQPPEFRDISDPNVRATLREYARLDGAVIIDEEGLVKAAGVHINADTRNVALLIEGARHATAAAITNETDAVAVTVSEKTGTVRIFKGGKAILKVAV